MDGGTPRWSQATMLVQTRPAGSQSVATPSGPVIPSTLRCAHRDDANVADRLAGRLHPHLLFMGRGQGNSNGRSSKHDWRVAPSAWKRPSGVRAWIPK